MYFVGTDKVGLACGTKDVAWWRGRKVSLQILGKRRGSNSSGSGGVLASFSGGFREASFSGVFVENSFSSVLPETSSPSGSCRGRGSVEAAEDPKRKASVRIGKSRHRW